MFFSIDTIGYLRGFLFIHANPISHIIMGLTFLGFHHAGLNRSEKTAHVKINGHSRSHLLPQVQI